MSFGDNKKRRRPCGRCGKGKYIPTKELLEWNDLCDFRCKVLISSPIPHPSPPLHPPGVLLLFVLGRLSRATIYSGPIRTAFTHGGDQLYIFLFGHRQQCGWHELAPVAIYFHVPVNIRWAVLLLLPLLFKVRGKEKQSGRERELGQFLATDLQNSSWPPQTAKFPNLL